MSGWEGSDRRERLPADWEARRADRLAYDGYRCTWRLPSGKRCPRPATDVDHREAMADKHERRDLQSLCAHHHGQKSAREGNQARRARKASRFRPPEEHPGTIR
jgi:5-methylcytosine-specific restriction enzyme A